MVCARCSGAVASAFYGSDGVTVYCGTTCRGEDKIEVTAALLAARKQT